ncbi:hypothetical protein [Streptomyces sp. DSM 118878]
MTPGARAHRRLLAGAALGALLAPALLTGCAESVDPIERLGRKAAAKVPSRLTEEPRKPGAPQKPGAPGAPKGPRAKEDRCPGKATQGAAKPRRTPNP